MLNKQGFTLVELIIVIIILGILAVYAVPKFISMDKEARASVMKNFTGSVKSASDMVHGLAVAQGKAVSPSAVVDTGRGNVNVAYGYALATKNGGITVVINDDLLDFEIVDDPVGASSTSLTFKHKGAKDSTKCSVTYTFDRGINSYPSITNDLSDCG